VTYEEVQKLARRVILNRPRVVVVGSQTEVNSSLILMMKRKKISYSGVKVIPYEELF